MERDNCLAVCASIEWKTSRLNLINIFEIQECPISEALLFVL